MSSTPKKDADLRRILNDNDLNLPDIYCLAVMDFRGMIKMIGPRVVLHIKHPPRAKKVKP